MTRATLPCLIISYLTHPTPLLSGTHASACIERHGSLQARKCPAHAAVAAQVVLDAWCVQSTCGFLVRCPRGRQMSEHQLRGPCRAPLGKCAAAGASGGLSSRHGHMVDSRERRLRPQPTVSQLRPNLMLTSLYFAGTDVRACASADMSAE